MDLLSRGEVRLSLEIGFEVKTCLLFFFYNFSFQLFCNILLVFDPVQVLGNQFGILKGLEANLFSIFASLVVDLTHFG
jgi:hypothetical protein